MAVERGDSTAPVGGTSSDTPGTFETSTLKGTTTTGNARLIVRDATQIAVIDTYSYWISNTVEGVLDEIANLIGLGSNIQDQVDALDVRITSNDVDIGVLDGRVTANEGDIAQEVIDRAAADTVVDDANLSLDGSDTMTGAINTSVGTMYSTKASSATDAPWQMTNSSDIYSNVTYRYMSCLDVNSKGLVISNEAGLFGAKQLLIDATGYDGLFDSLKFLGGGTLGQVLFSTNGSTNSFGFNPGADSVITSGTTMSFAAGGGSSTFLTLDGSSVKPGNSSTTMGLLASPYTNYYSSGQYKSSAAAPVAAEDMTRKDYVDAKAVDEAIAFAIALGG